MRRLPPRGRRPTTLVRSAATAARSVRAAIANGKSIKFDGAVYGAEDVRLALSLLQNGNCAYCEATVEPVSVGDIEHFRPKGGVINEDTNREMRPGYYWLAYTWNNLFISCPRCNNKFKGQHFPLRNEAGRARLPQHSLQTEMQLLINPIKQNPSIYLCFHHEEIFAVDGNDIGLTTISTLGLDRDGLNVARKARLQLVSTLRSVVQAWPATPEGRECALLLQVYEAPDAEFSLCVRSEFG